MCEIAILDPRRNEVGNMVEAAQAIYDRMHSSLGLVNVRDLPESEKFSYQIYKATDPDAESITDFITHTKQDDHSIRLIIHGRLATQGKVTREHAHPLRVDCPECDIDYVLHNGVIRQFKYQREEHEEDGHEYETNVDSEVLAHEMGSMPTDFSDEVMDVGSYEPAFILLNEDRVFIRSSHYHLAEDGRMSRSRRRFGPRSHEDDYGAVIITPTSPDESDTDA